MSLYVAIDEEYEWVKQANLVCVDTPEKVDVKYSVIEVDDQMGQVVSVELQNWSALRSLPMDVSLIRLECDYGPFGRITASVAKKNGLTTQVYCNLPNSLTIEQLPQELALNLCHTGTQSCIEIPSHIHVIPKPSIVSFEPHFILEGQPDQQVLINGVNFKTSTAGVYKLASD